MSEQELNRQEINIHKEEALEQAEPETAATAVESTPVAAPSSASATQTPLNNIDTHKLVQLLKNPSSALKLQPLTEWIYGAIGAAVGVLGFFFWIWSIQEAIPRDPFRIIQNLVLFSLFGSATPGKFLLIGLFSIVLLVGSLTLIGNWIGASKRSWMEAVTFQGSTQLLFGTGWIVSGIVAFVSLQLSMLLGVILLLINLLLVVTQAESLHDVSSDRRFLFIVYSMTAYMFLLYLAYSIIT